MKRLFAACVAWCVVLTGHAYAQQPIIQPVFGVDPLQYTENCPGVGVQDEIYFVALNFDMFIAGVQFAVVYPPLMTWLADVDIPPVTIGSTPGGISCGYGVPLNGYSTVVLFRALIVWNCASCEVLNEKVEVVAHPVFGTIEASDWPDFGLINPWGGDALVCAAPPTEATTWGRLKSLYNH